MTFSNLARARATAALKLTYVADALSMPVHWFYNPQDIFTAFPAGIQKFEAAPPSHPHNFLTLPDTKGKQIVGEVILKDKAKFWGVPHQHVHQSMQAGENTLNAHCARLVTRTLIENGGHYDANIFLTNYIAFMTSDSPQHPDTYAEAYHRGFFENLDRGLPANQCGVAAETTASVGGLVTIAPIVIAGLLAERDLTRTQKISREHIWLTHPDEALAKICDAYVKLIYDLLFRGEQEDAKAIIAKTAQDSANVNLNALCEKSDDDNDIIGGVFIKACPITDSWPSLLYLAYKYNADPKAALLANTNVGGENCHRGSVLGVILGLSTANGLDELFSALHQTDVIAAEITQLLSVSSQV
jgi:ADP-ribosylglycohydrolase